jgi:hypothetical protein
VRYVGKRGEVVELLVFATVDGDNCERKKENTTFRATTTTNIIGTRFGVAEPASLTDKHFQPKS